MAKPVTDHFDPPQAADEIGRFGKYRVLKQLGGGGMGAVFAAEHLHLEQPFALKFMLADAAADPDARRRFLAEARAAVRVKHAHVVAVTDVDELKGVPFIAMEWLHGRSLADQLDADGSPTVKQTLRVGWEAANGLAAVHSEGLVHRDIKPSNLWLAAPNGTVKVIDFGLAADTTRNTRHTRTGALLGTPEYAAPEQLQDARRVGTRADLFSLGVVLYQLLTGESPFRREDDHGCLVLYPTIFAVVSVLPRPPAERRPDIPRALSDLVMRLLAKNPEDRPESAKVVADELRAIRKAISSTAVRKPSLLVAPFDERTAKEGQEAWSRFLGRPVVEMIDLGGGVKLELLLIPPGAFTMGSPETEAGRRKDEEPHEVTITKPFYLGKYPVTQAEYRAVMTAVAGVDPEPSRFKGDRLPVECVSHTDAEAFCGRLRLPGGRTGLPSEAQWEYACRAGTTTPFNFGGVLNGRQANCDGNIPYGTDVKGPYLKQTRAVGGYAANAFGLFDTHGNVWEWCADRYGPYSAVTDPEIGQLGNQSEDFRMVRGGAWTNNPDLCRAACRDGDASAIRDYICGFRVCVRLD